MQKLRKIFRSRKRRSPNAADVGGGSQPQPPSNASPVVVQQGPVLHAPETETPAAPTLSSTPTAGSVVAPSANGLGSGPSNDYTANGSTPAASSVAGDLPVTTGNTPVISKPEPFEDQTQQDRALAGAVRGAHDNRDGAGMISERTSNAVQFAQDGVVAADDWSDRVDNLFKQLSAFCNVLGDIGEIHPYVRLVTGIITAGMQPILKQKARDDAMKKLIEDMNDTFDRVMADKDVNSRNIRENDPRCKLLAKLAKQTADCAWFIREYYETKSFMKRALTGIVNYEVDEKIKQYSTAFVELGDKIAKWDISQPAKLVSKAVAQIDATFALQELVYAEVAGRQYDKACLTGTRVATLACLADWIFDPGATRVHFVVGVAGSGKSSIAHSIASRLEAFGRLGAFFAFDRTNQRLAPWSVFSTVARELADWNADFRHGMSAILSQKGRLAKSRDVFEQWEDLIVRPAQNVHFVGPVLIVVDAFDECTDLRGPALAFDRDQQDRQRARKNMLECLTNRVDELPANFRILVTSRLEEDVVAVANSAIRAPTSCAVVFSDLGQAEVEAHEGIRLYIHHELGESLGDEQINVVVKAADGLFEWAAAICRYLLDPFAGGYSVLDRYRACLEGPAGIVHEPSHSLELLYAKILGQRFTGEVGLECFRDVMAQVLYAAEPVSLDTLVALRRAVDDGDKAVNLVIPHLGSLLSGVSKHSLLIRPLHSSFRNFLTRADSAHSWHVQPGDVHDVIALGALRVLNKSLHFDIWDFPSSYTPNEYFNDVDDRMKKLPAGLMYASWHWSHHLSMASKSAVSLQTELRIFLTQKLLFWLEVVSLCGFMHRAVPSLLTAVSFFRPLHDDDVIAFINDAILFINNCIKPIQYSAPHIYLSALAFCPTTSLVRRSFVRNSNLLPTVDGLEAEWPVVFCPHNVSCFAYSPNGIYMALGCMDGNVRLVEAASMHKSVLELSRAPGTLTGVSSVVFSPDGQIIAAAARMGDVMDTILRWNVETGELLGMSHGHTDYVRTLCFSPDSRYIVSASIDETVRRWDAETGKQVGHPLRGHTGAVLGAVYSLNSEFIISSSTDATVRIWGADTGHQYGPPIPIPEGLPARELSRSPRSNLVAIAVDTAYAKQRDGTTWVFDIDKLSFDGGPMRGHSDDSMAIAWSPDGLCIASASSDGNIRLYDDLGSRSRVLYYHTKRVSAIEFQPDGKRLIMADEDGDLRTVDVAAAHSQSSEYQSGPAEYAAYSPDGRFAAVTFGGKKPPSVWDSETGAPISDDSILAASRDWLKSAMDGSSQHYDRDGWDERNTHRPHDIASANGFRSAGVYGLEISVWDSASQAPLMPSIRIPSGAVTCIALSPSGDCVLQGSSDGTVRIFNVEQSADNASLPAEDSASGIQCSYIPEGEHTMLRPGPGFAHGRLYDKKDRQVIYVPEQYRADLWLPGLVHILRPNREPARPVKIDVSGVGFGKEWTRCAGALSVDLGNAPVSSEPVANN